MKQIIENPLYTIIAYFICGFLTFGHAYHQVPDTEKGYVGSQEYIIHNGVGTKVYGAMLSSMVWPLYWSVQVWRPSNVVSNSI